MSRMPKSICPFCNLGCILGFEVKNGEYRRVDYVPEARNEGRLCPKGNAAVSVLNHRKRLYHPIIKKEPTTLAEGTEYLRNRLAEFKPQEVLLIYDSSFAAEEIEALYSLASKQGYNVSYCTLGPEAAFLYGKVPEITEDVFLNAEYALIVGDAFAQDSVISGYIGKGKQDRKNFTYVTVDSLGTITSAFGNPGIKVNPGLEGLFLYGLYRYLAADESGISGYADAVGIEASVFEKVSSIIRSKKGVLVNAPARGRSFDPFLTHGAGLLLSKLLKGLTYIPLGARVPSKVVRSFFSFLPEVMSGHIKAILSLGTTFPWGYPQLRPVLKKISFLAAGNLFIPQGRFEMEAVLPVATELEKQGSIRTLFGSQKLAGPVPQVSGTLSAAGYIENLGEAKKPEAEFVENHPAIGEKGLSERAEKLASAPLAPKKPRNYLLMGSENAIGFLGIFSAEDWVRLNPADASVLSLSSGELAGVETEQGQAELKVLITPEVPSGTAVVSTNHYPSLALLDLGTDSGTSEGLLKPSWSRIWKK